MPEGQLEGILLEAARLDGFSTSPAKTVVVLHEAAAPTPSLSPPKSPATMARQEQAAQIFARARAKAERELYFKYGSAEHDSELPFPLDLPVGAERM